MFEETSKIAEITVLPQEGNIQVAYDKQVTKDGEVISKKLHYELYSAEKRDQFTSDIENPANGGAPGMAAPYIVAVGW